MSCVRLNDRVIVQSKTKTRDALGQSIEAWSEFITLWANVRFKTGVEFISADKEHAATQASCRINWRTNITTEMRLTFRGVVYNIIAVLPDDKRRHVDLVIEAGLSNG